MQPLGCQVNKAGTGNTRKVTRQNMQIFYQPTHFFLGLFEAGIHVYEAIVVGVPRTVSVSETRYRLHPVSGECLPLVCKRNDIPAYARNWCLTAKHAQWQAKITTA